TLTQYQQLAKNRAADRISTLELLQKYGKGEDKKIKSKNSDRKNKLKINGKSYLNNKILPI
ncbi:20921_t:CDS:1, partial [Gigaspora rosea]